MSEIERDKPGLHQDEGLADRVADSTLAVVMYAGWLLVSAAVGIGLLEGGPFGIARTLFAAGLAVVIACLPLAWAKGWTDD